MSLTNLQNAARDPKFKQQLTDLLMELCRIDTTPQSDVAAFAQAESKVFDVLERELSKLDIPGASFQRRAIDPAIGKHPFYSHAAYTKTATQLKPLPAAKAYHGRSNLYHFVDPIAANDENGAVPCQGIAGAPAVLGGGIAINGHIDVVKPYIAASIDGDVMYGRGTCDDKGPVVAMVGALQLIAGYLKDHGLTLKQPLTTMFVIDEEIGGNGSLAAALDGDLKKRYDRIAVQECTGSNIYPGNRGCVWYKVDGHLPGVNLFEASAFIYDEMEKEGRAIRSESDHELFPHRPVQTCHGILGCFGEHPSRINGRIDFEIVLQGMANPAKVEKLVRDVIEFALQDYIGLYGDKTKANDPLTGKPKVDHHYDLLTTATGFTLQVHGSTGHMGSIFVNDGAITKMATLLRGLIASRETIRQRSGATQVVYQLKGWADSSLLTMEGGQGFLPTHAMTDIQARQTQAVQRGLTRYLRLTGHAPSKAAKVKVTFEKLHNAAFAGDKDSPSMRRAIEAAKQAGLWKDQPIRGWDVSCDSRIFACQYPDLTVLTMGPGDLVYAHADNEQINLTEMVRHAEMLAIYLLKETATII